MQALTRILQLYDDQLEIAMENGECRYSSKDLARVIGRQHSNVMRDIRRIRMPHGFRSTHFDERVEFFKNPVSGQDMAAPWFSMTGKGLMYMILWYHGTFADKIKTSIIDAFFRMERDLNLSTTVSEQEAYDMIERLQNEIMDLKFAGELNEMTNKSMDIVM